MNLSALDIRWRVVLINGAVLFGVLWSAADRSHALPDSTLIAAVIFLPVLLLNLRFASADVIAPGSGWKQISEFLKTKPLLALLAAGQAYGTCTMFTGVSRVVRASITARNELHAATYLIIRLYLLAFVLFVVGCLWAASISGMLRAKRWAWISGVVLWALALVTTAVITVVQSSFDDFDFAALAMLTLLLLPQSRRRFFTRPLTTGGAITQIPQG